MIPAELAIPASSSLDEETARAEVYGLLAALYYAAPSQSLHDTLCIAATQAPAAGAVLESTWSELVAAARAQTLTEITQEFDALFGGVSRPEVFLFGFHFLSCFLK